MDPGSGSLELPADGSKPEPLPADTPPIDLGLPQDVVPELAAPAPAHRHVVVGPHDADLVDDPNAGSSPTLVRDPIDLEPRDAVADVGSSPTLVRDPLDIEPPRAAPSVFRLWLPYLAAALLVAILVFTCGAVT